MENQSLNEGSAMRAESNVSAAHSSTGRQRRIRRESSRLPLKNAIHLAADVCYRFKGRSPQGKALWSETERVWLGRDTFLHWSLRLEDIDIPWAVATAVGAPHDTDQLCDAVQTELTSYFADRLQALPCQEQPNWLPLP
jgi:hypothetical protein